MMGQLQGKRVLVVGANRGIGAAIARRFWQEGAVVACAARSAEDAEVTANEILSQGGKAVPVTLDLLRRQSILEGVTSACDQLGHIDVFVQSGGVTATTPFVDIGEDEWHRVLNTNLSGTFFACQAVTRHMIDANISGSIIVVTSQLSVVAIPNKAHYLASKGGLSMLIKSLSLEVADRGIRVNGLAPGVTATDMALSRLDHDETALEWTLNRIPMGRLAKPEEMTGGAVFLASDDATYVTGTTLVIDGGYLAK